GSERSLNGGFVTVPQSVPSLITSATLLSLGSTITICCAVRKNLWAFTCGTFWLTSLGIGRGVMPGGIGSPIGAWTSAASAFISFTYSLIVCLCPTVRITL